jgi:hypothetical protein
MVVRTIALVLFVFSAGSALSEPIVSGVSGTLENGSEISISGSLFGSNGPDVILFDDFESGTVGSPIQTGPGSAEFGQWNGELGNTVYSNAASVSGSQAFRADMSEHWLNYAEVSLPPNTRDVFISWWLYLPAGDKIPGEGSSTGTNWKQMWIQGSDTADDDVVVPTLLSQSWYINGNDSPYRAYPGVPYLVKGQWKHFACWIKGGYNNDGAAKFWHLGHTGDLDLFLDESSVTTMYADGFREKVRLNGFGRTTSNSHPMFDDMYVASGANAQARVEIGDKRNYYDCTNVAIAVPTNWSANYITATLHTGSLYAGPAYLFVVDADGTVSEGYPIELGGTVEPEGPGQPGQPKRNS